MKSRRPVFLLFVLICLVNQVVVPAERLIIPSSNRILTQRFFGIHVHRLGGMHSGENNQFSVPDLNFGILRTWDAYLRWADLEPNRGVWNFQKLDHYVDFAVTRGMDVVLTLGSTPKWASLRPLEPCAYYPEGCAAPPADLRDWEAYVRTIVKRYKGKICCYEVWNEPDFSGPPKQLGKRAGFYSGSVEKLVSLARAAKSIIAEEDPAALLLGPGFVNGVANRLTPYLEAGGGRYMDVMSYHFYAWYDDRRMLSEISAVKALMEKSNIKSLPLWSTEAGVEVISSDEYLPPGYIRVSREEAAAHAVRQIVIAAFHGLDRYIYYSWDHRQSGLVDSSGKRYPVHGAIERLMNQLTGARLGACHLKGAHIISCRAALDGKVFDIVWNTVRENEECRSTIFFGNVISVQSLVTGEYIFDHGRVIDKNERLCVGKWPLLLWYAPSQ